MDDITHTAAEDDREVRKDFSYLSNSSVAMVTEEVETMYQEAEKLILFELGTYIQRYLLPVIVFAGIVGNFLSMAVLFRNRKLSFNIYAGTLGVTDTVILLVGGYYWAATDGPAGLRHSLLDFPLGCQLLIAYVWQFCGMTGVYLILAMTVDRLIAVTVPHKAAVWCTARRAGIVCRALPVVCALLELPQYFVARPVGDKLCAGFQIKSLPVTIYYWVNTCLYCYIPFTLLCVCNVVIIIKVKQSKMAFEGQISGNKVSKFSRKELQMIVTLALVTFTFLILNLPIYIRYVIYMVKSPYDSAEAYATFNFAAQLTNKLVYANSAVNFFLYCLSGPRFRRDLKRVVCCAMFTENGGLKTTSNSGDASVYEIRTESTKF